jgi:SAM-dependent methyltransferase
MADTAVAGLDAAAIERERAFHDARFADEHRQGQWKFYEAIRGCSESYEAEVMAAVKGADVLDYGCAEGKWSLVAAKTAKHVEGIDISKVAIEHAAEKAAEEGLTNVSFQVADAHHLPFADESFDVVFGSAIIHHLDTEQSLKEIRRVLKPGGIALFKEPLGSNVAFNLYRRLTPQSRTVDEHPLVPKDFAIARKHFSKVSTTHYGLTALGFVPFRNSFAGPALYKTLCGLDRALFKVPFLKWQAWFVMIRFYK